MTVEALGFTRLASKYKNQHQQTAKEITRALVEENAAKMVEYAKKYLDEYVYNAPIPDSAKSVKDYEALRRSHRTENAIRVLPTQALSSGHSAGAEVSKEDYPAFFYAEILNAGGGPGTRIANYRARPFWTMAKVKMRAQAPVIGRAKLKEFRNRLAP